MVEVLTFFDLLQEHKLNFAIKEEAKREWCSAYDWEISGWSSILFSFVTGNIGKPHAKQIEKYHVKSKCKKVYPSNFVSSD